MNMKTTFIKKLISFIEYIGGTLFSTGLAIFFGDVTKFMNFVPFFTIEGALIFSVGLLLEFLNEYYKED